MIPLASVDTCDFAFDQAPNLTIAADATECQVSLSLTDDAGTRWYSAMKQAIPHDKALNIVETLISTLKPDVDDIRRYLAEAKSPYGRPHFNQAYDPRNMHLNVIKGENTQRFEFVQRPIQVGTEVFDINQNGIVGRLFVPPGAVLNRPIIVIGGSGGGLEQVISPVLSQTRPVLSLAVFAYTGRPDYHDSIDVGYVARAAQWLTRRFQVDAVGIIGVSRGAELALLAAIHHKNLIERIVAVVPGNVITGGMTPEHPDNVPAWCANGKAMAFVGAAHLNFPAPSNKDEVISLRNNYKAIFEDKNWQRIAGLAIEQTDCPILLMGAKDDQLWPSDIGAEQLYKRADSKRVSLALFEEAGHLMAPTNTVTSLSQSVFHPIENRFYATGGDPYGQAKANKRFWTGLLNFIDG